MIISKKDFFGSVMLDFEARTVLPCTHDINCMWSGSWDYETNTRALAYVVGLQGWWDGKVGFEAYCSYIQIRNFRIYELSYETVNKEYKPEF